MSAENRQSGESDALANIDEARLQAARELGPQKIAGICLHFEGPAIGMTTVSWGEIVVYQDRDFTMTKPIVAFIIPGHLPLGMYGQEIEIPDEAKPISAFFPKE